jgi:hypothetical protein
VAIPIQLTVGNILNRRTISLDAVNFNLSIERNISVFAAPFNTAFKVGIDPNMSATSVNISGVLIDDGAASGPATPASTSINLRPYFANSNNLSWATGIMADIMARHERAKSLATVAVNTTAPFNVKAVRSLSHFFAVGDTVYLDDGKTLGVITAMNSSSPSTITIGAGTQTLMRRHQSILTTSPDLFLDGKGFTLMPRYWLNNPPNPSWPQLPISYRFDSTLQPSYSGGSAVPVLVTGSEAEGAVSAAPTIRIPIQGIYNSSTNGKPATSLASIIKDAIESTFDVTHGKVTTAGGTSSNDAFSVQFADVDQTVLHITQKEMGSGVNWPELFPLAGISQAPSGQGLEPWTYNYEIVVSFWGLFWVTNHTRNNPQIPMSRPFSGGSEALGSKSAGDKAQDLIGIFANSPVSSADDIVGIQIPYETLVTSSSVSTEVRNFFLTFGGQIPKGMKTSDHNYRSASAPIELMGRQVREQAEDSDEESDIPVIGDILDALGDIWDTAKNIFTDIFIEIGGTSNSGNRGGMLIIPAKLNIHQEAGQPFYTFDMRLHAAQHKIAP